MKYINQYSVGSEIVTHKGKKLTVGRSASISSLLDSLLPGCRLGTIPAGYEHRPDLISNLFYGTVTNDWILVMINNIKDPFQQLNVGDSILIPTL